jgi:hypothetical protein
MYDVRDFDESNFSAALATKLFSVESVQNDKHASYLFGYLSHADVAAKSIIVEREYVDGDFLDDFTSYYATCFENFDRYCRRVHFFSKRVVRVEFEAIISGLAPAGESESFRDSYLGFIVVRPLPDAIIGRTQIRTYGSDGGRRHYRAVLDYSVHLFGLPLFVRSLAFQEQDRALSACATVAMWSCFQKTARLFGTPAPRPPKITRDATETLHDRRSFPSDGLTLDQMCSAIRQNGLDPEVTGHEGLTQLPLASMLYAYLEAELPVLLLVEVEGLGGHAVTLSGYSRRQNRVHQTELTRGPGKEALPSLPGLYIDEFYAHDDQHGPFSKLLLVPSPALNTPFTFQGSWLRDDGKARSLVPRAVIAPVYPKIRLTYAQALQWLQRIRPLAEGVARNAGYAVEWNLFLTTTNAYKNDLRATSNLSSPRRLNLLGSSQPRFFWRCLLLHENGEPILEMLIDATGFSKSFPILAINFFDEAFASQFAARIASLGSHPLLPKPLRVLIQSEFIDRFGPATKSQTSVVPQQNNL